MKRTIEITIKRPTGETEVIDVSGKFSAMTDALFAQIKTATIKAGKGEPMSYRVTDVDDRTEAEKAWEQVRIAFIKADAAREASYYDPEKICRLDVAADKAKAAWVAAYPQEAADMDAKAAQRAADHQAEIRSRPGYQATLEGRD